MCVTNFDANYSAVHAGRQTTCWFVCTSLMQFMFFRKTNKFDSNRFKTNCTALTHYDLPVVSK